MFQLHHGGEYVTSWGEYVTSWGEYVTSWREYVTSWGEYVTSWGEYVTSWGEYVTSWGEYVTSWGKYVIIDVMMMSTLLNLYCTSSLKQQPVDRRAAPLGHIILIPRRPVFTLTT
jgi:hypothetical protein